MSSAAALQSAEAQAALDPTPEAQTSLDPFAPLLTSAALCPLDETAWLRVTGDDRLRWLNAMATQSIQALTPGQGGYTFFLNAQGRILADANVFLRADDILLETSSAQLPTLLAHLDHFIIMDDVELQPLDHHAGVLLAGPDAPALLARIALPPASAGPLTLTAIDWQAASIDLLHAHSPVVPRFELWADPTTIGLLSRALQTAGATPSTPEALNQLRILEGTPLFGTDIRNSDSARDLPQETTPTGVPSRALHFSKGCYLGQEIVERIHSRGNLHRTFSGFTLTGELPTVGTLLFESGKPDKSVGELTSVTRLPLPGGPAQLALGYLRRETLDRAASLLYAGGTASPSSLPFPPART